MTELERIQTALFVVIRNSQIMPMGLKLGKSKEEINLMAYETMFEVCKMIDFDLAYKSYKAAEKEYLAKLKKFLGDDEE